MGMNSIFNSDTEFAKSIRARKHEVEVAKKGNPPGKSKRPGTWMESPENGHTVMSDGTFVPQKRSDRKPQYQQSGRYHHKPWPFKKTTL